MKYDVILTSNEEAISAATVCGINENEAVLLIIANFMYWIKKKAGNFINSLEYLALEFEDLYNEGLRSITHAIETFDVCKGCFTSYVQIVIHRQMWGLIKKARSAGRKIHTNALSLDAQLYKENDRFFISDSIGELEPYQSSETLPNSMIDHVGDLVSVRLDEDEICVIKLKIAGFNYGEIAEKLGCSRRQVFAVIKSIKSKYGW